MTALDKEYLINGMMFIIPSLIQDRLGAGGGGGGGEAHIMGNKGSM